jgi:hypothetical protein
MLVKKENYLLELSRYIVLNPVRAGMVRSVRAWPWSSYRATTGQLKGSACLNVDWLLGAFGKRKSDAVKRYIIFVSDGKGQPSPWFMLRNQVYLGSEQFVEKIQSFLDDDRELSEVPASQRRPVPKALGDYEASSHDRNTAITNAYRGGGCTLKQIGNHFGLHYSTVSPHFSPGFRIQVHL